MYGSFTRRIMEASAAASDNAFRRGFSAGQKGEPRVAPVTDGYDRSWLLGYDQAVAQQKAGLL
jgi:hypothetical protein